MDGAQRKTGSGTLVAVALFRRAGWAPLAVFALSLVLTLAFSGYDRWPGIDVPMHLLGGVAIAHFVASGFAALPESAIARAYRRKAACVCIVGVTAVAALAWEFAEYALDRSLHEGMDRGSGDTLFDLALGLAGAVVYVVVAAWRGNLGDVRPLGASRAP